MSSGKRGFLGGILAGIAVAVALLALVGPLQDLLPEAGELSRSDEARQVIEDSYFRETDTDELENASVTGMVKEISRANEDKFSHFFDPATYRRFQDSTSGKFSGIGLSVGEDKRGLLVVKVFEDTPAEDAGITAGDLIVAVEGKSLAGVSSDAAASQIKGGREPRSSITVVDGKTGEKEDLDVERANVKIPAVAVEDGGGRRRQDRLRQPGRLHHRRPRRAPQRDRVAAAPTAPRASSSTSVATAAACSTRRS